MTERNENPAALDVKGLGSKIMLVIVLLIPLGFAGLGGWFIVEGMRFSANAVKLQAMVIDSGRISREDGDLFRPVFRFQTPQGELREAPAHSADSDFGFARGAIVNVLYNPDQPDHVRPHGFWLQYGLWSIFLALGLFVFAVFAWAISTIIFPRRTPPDAR